MYSAVSSLVVYRMMKKLKVWKWLYGVALSPMDFGGEGRGNKGAQRGRREGT
jgi:hypothetical protein